MPSHTVHHPVQWMVANVFSPNPSHSMNGEPHDLYRHRRGRAWTGLNHMQVPGRGPPTGSEVGRRGCAERSYRRGRSGVLGLIIGGALAAPFAGWFSRVLPQQVLMSLVALTVSGL